MSIKKQTLSGFIWTFIDIFVLKGAAFIASLILARLLGPKVFGLIGMIAIFISIGTSLIDSGLSSSIIRTKDADSKDFTTVFYTNLLMSTIIYLILFFCAQFIATFYKQPILIPIIRLYSLTFIISSFSSIQTSILIKNMEFKKAMYLNIPGTLLGVVVGISMGFLGYGIWSIVWMYLATQIIQSIMLWFFSNWKPTLYFSKDKLRIHFTFGYKLMLSGLLNTSFDNIYNVVIGKFYSVQILGYYERAFLFNQYPVTALSGIISKVTYPLLANIQDDKERIEHIYKNILQVSFFISAPIMLGASAIAKPLFLLVLGTQWAPAVPFFQIICLASILYPVHAVNINILKVYGRSDLFLKLEIIKKVILGAGVLVGFAFGIYGLVWSSVITSVLALIVNTYFSKDMINYTTKSQLFDMLPTFVSSILMFGLMYSLVYLLSWFPKIVQIIIPAILGFSFYVLISYILKLRPYVFLVKLIKEKNI